jgi:hypothetical protein
VLIEPIRDIRTHRETREARTSYELRTGDTPVELDDITEFFKRLNPHMAAPVTENSIWRTSDAGVGFEPNAAAPIMRTQNIVHLVGVITGWYKGTVASANMQAAGWVDASSPCLSVRAEIGLRRVSVSAGGDHLGGAVVPALWTLLTVTWRSCWPSAASPSIT